MKCQNCGEPIEWDAYWTCWDHAGRNRKLTAELCYPEQGWDGTPSAQPMKAKP